MGQPRKDTVNTQHLIINLAKNGLSNTAIAEATGLSRQTVQNWLKDTELGKSVKAIREVKADTDAKQKYALHKSAIAATKKLLKQHKSAEVIERFNEAGNLIYTEKRTRDVDPNASIVQFVLKTIDSKNWSEQPDVKAAAELRIIIDNDNTQQYHICDNLQ